LFGTAEVAEYHYDYVLIVTARVDLSTFAAGDLR
jgi:hypothetical protein